MSPSAPEYGSLEMAMSPPRPGTFSIRDSATRAGEDQETLNLAHIDFVHKDTQGDTKDDAENFT